MIDFRKFLDRLLDEDDWGIVELENSRGEKAYFEQVCLLPESDNRYYAILQPVTPDGEETDDPVVFVFDNVESDNVTADIVTDQYIIHDVFAEYKRLRKNYDDEDGEFYEETEDSFGFGFSGRYGISPGKDICALNVDHSHFRE